LRIVNNNSNLPYDRNLRSLGLVTGKIPFLSPNRQWQN